MADNTPGFNSLDPLGPEYGKINQPIIDPKGLSPFEGDRMRDAPINFPAMPGLDLSLPNRNVRQNAVGAPGKPANANKQATAQDVINAQGSLIKAIGQASQSKDSYAKIYSYNAGPDGNAFYKRYQAYGQEKFDEIGFSPLRDNEATFNARTTRWDDFSRMMTHSFFPLLASGFTSGPRSLFRMLQGDFTGADLEDARLYEEAAAIGQSSKGGVFGFVNNTVMNFGYTVGIISEVILEEMGAALLAPGTGGTSFAAATIRNLERIKGVGTAIKGFKAMRNSLSELKGIQAVRNFKNSVNAGLTSKVGRFLNPLENTFEALQLAKADNLTGLAATFKTAGGLYRDIRTVNMAVSEARLEAGMVENSVYDDLYNEHYNLTGEAPDNKTQQDMQRQAKDASGNTFYWNAGLIYATNKITFNNITGPRGGIRKFIKSVQDDFVSVGGGKFGNVGKIVYDNVAKKFAYEATNLKNLAKSWWKDPGFKTAAGTIGYFKANISEGLQENMQEIISRTNEGYYKDSFNSKARRAQEYARGAALYAGKTQSDYFKKELGEEFSMKGLETFGSGFFMGMLAAPLNNSIPFLSKQWNRMFDQKGYTDYVEKKEKMAEGIVEVLNNIDMKDFIKSNMFNLSAQDFINEIKARASKKEGMDAELEGLIDSVEMMLQTNTTDVFTDHLNSFFDLSEDEFMEAMGNIEKSEIPEYKTRITKSIDKIKSIKKKYDYYKQKKPNPVTDAYLSTLDKDSEEYEEAVSLQAGWDRAVKNAVFFNEAYEDTMQRMVDIQSEFLSKTTLKNMGAREMGLIFQPQKIKNEIELLKNDIEVAEQAKSTLPGAAEDLAKKKRMLAQMEDYAEKFKAFDIFYNRTDYYSAHRDEVKKQLGIDLTDEEVEAIFNEQLGALDGTESQAKVLGELKESLANYLKTVADINEDTVFDENIDQGFTLLADHYKLYRESLAMVEAINTLHDPGNFSDLARRNQAWMKDLYNRRAEYYEKIVKGEMEDVEFNALLNKLADSGIAVTPEDFVEWKNNRTIPKEFIDIANKRIIPQNSEKYAAAVDLFERATALRDDTTVVSTEIQDAEYKRQLAALEADMQAEIDALPKVEERLVTGSIEPTAKSKSFTLNKVRKELAIGEQAELVDTKGERIIVRKDENEQLVDEAGELVDNNKRYVAGEKFRMSMVADEAAVKEIEDRYTEKRIALKEKFLAAQENVEKPPVVEEMTIADIMTKEPELYQQLLTAYEAMMVEDMGVDDFATLSDSQRENGLAKFIKSAKGKLIVDAYQEKQKISKSAQTEANEMTFTLDGTSYDTSTITSVPQLRNFIKQFNAKIATIKKKKIQDSADTEAILDLQSMINGMNLLIDKRLQSGATDELKAAIAKIKVMQLNQKDIVKQDLKSITIPKDDRAWKKGDIRYTKQGIRVEYKGDNLYNIAGEDRVFDTSTPNASSFQRSIDTAIYTANPQEVPNVYMIKGTEHERVSYAIKSVYDVFGLNEKDVAILNTAFDVTIGTKGFNEESIKAFVDDLRATKESDNGKLGGFSTYTFDEIEGDLLGFYDSMTIMGGAPTSAPINFYQIDSGQIRVSTGDDGSRMVDITSEDFNQIVSQLSPEQKEKFKEYLRAEIEKIPEKRKKAAKGSGYMASNYDQTQVLKLEKELKETLAALEGSAPTSNIDPKRADVEARLRKLAVGLKEEEIKQVLDIPIEQIINEVKKRANNNPNTLVGSLVVYYALRLEAEMAAIRIPVGEKTKLIEVVKVIDKLTPSTTSDIEKQKEVYKRMTKGTPINKDAPKGTKVGDKYDDRLKIIPVAESLADNFDAKKADNNGQGYEVISKVIEYGEMENGVQTKAPKIETIIFNNKADADAFFAEEKVKLDKNIADAESAAQTTPGTVDIEEIRKLALNTAAEQSYEASKKVGNYTDKQSKRIFDGEAPEFDEERITKEAYDELFDPKTGYLTQLKERADKGEFFIATDIVVYGEVVDANGKTRRIAGEIDLLIADRDGKIHIIDLKTGTYSKWQFYNNKGTIGYNKRIENTLQQMSYSNLVFNQYGLETNIGILPIEAKYDPDSADGKIMKAGRPTTKKLFEDDDMSLLESNKPFSVKLYKNQELQQLDENGEVVNTTAEELIGKIIPRKDGKSGASGPVRPGEDSTEDEAGPTGGTNAPNPTVSKGARQDQVDTYNDLRERIMKANLDELDELNTELFAAKVSSGITDEQYKDLVNLLEEAESELSIGEIEAVSINNVKLNSKLIAMDEFTTTTQKGKTTIISIIGANEKVVVAEILKDSIKVRTQDGNLVEVPANKISDIFVDAAKYEDEPGGPMDTPYKPTKEESIVITQTNDNVATFLDDNDAKTEAVQKGQSMTPKDALNDLNKIINCPG